MNSTIEPIPQITEITPLLSSCDLPVSDIAASALEPLMFFGCRQGFTVIGVIGLEHYGTVALLRSLAVAPAHRTCGLGKKLVTFAENYARSIGVETLFLLTTTAESFFLKLGYLPASRKDAPLSIQSTAQFSGLCPASSSFMSKDLGKSVIAPASTAIDSTDL